MDACEINKKINAIINSDVNFWTIQSRTAPKKEQREAAVKYIQAAKKIQHEINSSAIWGRTL